MHSGAFDAEDREPVRLSARGVDRVPRDVIDAMARIHRAGHVVWVVGGAPRDLFLGRDAKDWDLATTASPEEVTALFRRVIPLGMKHGTVVVHTRIRDMEVTSVPGAGEAAVLADLGRRDFTVNALALTFPEGRLLDPWNAVRDLAIRTLRGVGNPRSRFREDPLRVLRGLRFASTLGFRVEASTFLAMKAEAPGLRGVAAERIREELFKLLQGEGVIGAMDLAYRSGVLSEVLPELAAPPGEGRKRGRRRVLRTAAVVSRSPAGTRPRVAALLRGIGRAGLDARRGSRCPSPPRMPLAPPSPGAAPRRILDRWKLSRKDANEIGLLASIRLPLNGRRLTDEALRHIIVNMGTGLVSDLVDVEWAERSARGWGAGELERFEDVDARLHRLLSESFPLSPKELALSGREIMEAAGLGPGPAVGELLNRLFLRVLKDPALNDRKILMDFIKKNKL